MKEKLKDKYHDCGHRPRNTEKRKRMAKVKPQTQNEIQQPTGTKAQTDGQGWECCRCHAINAPFVRQCSCHGYWTTTYPLPSPYVPPWKPYEITCCSNVSGHDPRVMTL
jgi:hypothetical protein